MPQQPESEPAEQLLIEDQAALLAAIVASSSDAILSKNLAGVITSWNAAAEKFFGYSWSEMKGRLIHCLMPAELQEEEDRILARVASGQRVENYETVRLHKTGRRIDVSVTISPIRTVSGEVVGASSVMRDIGWRKKGDRALALLAAIVEASSDVILSKALDGTVTSWNPAAEDLFGFSASEIIGHSVRTLIPEELQSEEDEILARIAAGDRIQNFETVRLHKSGRRIQVSLTVSPVRDQSGKIIGASKILRDITQQKLIEREVALLAAIVTSTSDGILSWARTGSITSCNEAIEKLFGFAPSELKGQSAHLLIPEELRGEEVRIAASVLRGEHIPAYEALRLHKNGARINSSVTNSPIRDRDGAIIGGSTILRDITDRKRHEEQIRLLLREVNHRSKNLLAVVQAIARQSAAAKPSDFVERFTDRIRALSASQDLLTQGEWKGVKIHDLVESQLAHFRDLPGTTILLDGAGTLINPAAAQAIGMAVHELATNAGKYGALSGNGGRVKISWCIGRQQGAQDTFAMEWREFGLPNVNQPGEPGFGMSVITEIIERSLAGKAGVAFEQTGLRWRFECAAEEVTA